MTETKLERKTLRDWREEFGLTQKELAILADCSGGAIGNIERGEVAPDTEVGQRIAQALGLAPGQILRGELPADKIDISAFNDFSQHAPRKPVKWWRERHSLTRGELCRLAGISHSTLYRIEAGKRIRNDPSLIKRKLALALQVYPDSLALPGDKVSEEEKSLEVILAAQTRRQSRLLRRWQDAVLDGRYLTNRAYDDLDGLIKDTAQELEGT